jgi:hypothetical protein
MNERKVNSPCLFLSLILLEILTEKTKVSFCDLAVFLHRKDSNMTLEVFPSDSKIDTNNLLFIHFWGVLTKISFAFEFDSFGVFDKTKTKVSFVTLPFLTWERFKCDLKLF